MGKNKFRNKICLINSRITSPYGMNNLIIKKHWTLHSTKWRHSGTSEFYGDWECLESDQVSSRLRYELSGTDEDHRVSCTRVQHTEALHDNTLPVVRQCWRSSDKPPFSHPDKIPPYNKTVINSSFIQFSFILCGIYSVHESPVRFSEMFPRRRRDFSSSLLHSNKNLATPLHCTYYATSKRTCSGTRRRCQWKRSVN